MSTRGQQIRCMFDRISGRYDLLNRLISLGRHGRWKALAAEACHVPPGGIALDVCTGTADLALSLARRGPRAVALDFSPEMLAVGVRKAHGRPVLFVRGDALDLPFTDGCFDAAVLGFSLRNVDSISRLLSEMARVVRPGGWVVTLETSQPPSRLFRALYHAYLRFAISLTPLLSVGPAYRYLASSIFAFPGAEEVADLFRAVGLRDVSFGHLFLGVVAIHVGRA